MSWTPQQEEALRIRNKNLLLSAAAGSGKTAVLTERITRLAADPESHTGIHELLVLTFTKAAASEMKSRISASLTRELEAADAAKDLPLVRHLERQISLLSSAQISTLDAFFQSLVRQYFYLLDLDPKTRIMADENDARILADDVLTEVLERWYEEGDPDFLTTCDLFASGHQDQSLRQMILRMHRYASSMPFPDVWLTRLPSAYEIPGDATLDTLPWTQPILSELIDTAGKISGLYRQSFSLLDLHPIARDVYGETLSQEYAFFSSLAQVTTWQALYAMPSFTPKKMPSLSAAKAKAYGIKSTDFNRSPEAEAIKTLRDMAKDTYKKKLLPFLSITPSQWIKETRAMAPEVKVLSALALDFGRSYLARKKQEGVMEFNDLEHYTLSLLLDTKDPAFTPEHAEDFPSEAALSIRRNYKEVMIDEYQDTNGIQELITTLLSNGHNRFLVGDIKQSIYRFRQADPTIFLSKYHRFLTDGESGRRIDLNRNFRSDAAVLSSINYLFRQLMTEKNLELTYGDAEALYPGRHEETRPENYVGGRVTIELIDGSELAETDRPELKEISTIDAEGRLIASHIESLIQEGRQVMNKDGTFRPIRYGDIVILLRSIASKGPALLKILKEHHIPAVSSRDDDYVKNLEVQTLIALLQILDNPLQDLPLTAVLRSFFVGLTETDLARLRLLMKENEADHLFPLLEKAVPLLSREKADALSAFLTHFSAWREHAVQGGIAPLLQEIWEDTDYLTYVSGLPGGHARRAHLLSFYELARARDTGTHNGLYPFLTELSSLLKGDGRFQTKTDAVSTDAVRIMTIHSSKGLEFPVVFLADLAKNFNASDMTGIALCHKGLGLGIQYFDIERRLRWPSLYWYAVRAASERESRAEEARLLYVAMTRARDTLYLTASVKDAEKVLAACMTPLAGSGSDTPLPLPAHLISHARSYLDWILPAALHHRDLSPVWSRLEKIPSFQSDAAGDHSHFDFRIISQKDLLTESEKALLEESEKPETAKEEKNASPAFDREAFLAHLPETVPDWLSRQLTWRYAFPGATATPAKLTATAAVKLREEAEYAQGDEPPYASSILADDLEGAAKTEDLPADYSTPPAFLSEDTPLYSGTSFGTLMHKAMEMIDFTTLFPTEDALRKHIRTLSDKHVFTQEETKVLLSHRKDRNPVEALLTFAQSPLAALMRRAAAVRKEMPFSILLPARSFYPQCEDGETLFLQGIMDCLVEEADGLTIIDYKTDRTMTEEELKAHYKIQLQVYGESAEKLLGKPVKHLYLWSFTFGKEIEVARWETRDE